MPHCLSIFFAKWKRYFVFVKRKRRNYIHMYVYLYYVKKEVSFKKMHLCGHCMHDWLDCHVSTPCFFLLSKCERRKRTSFINQNAGIYRQVSTTFLIFLFHSFFSTITSNLWNVRIYNGYARALKYFFAISFLVSLWTTVSFQGVFHIPWQIKEETGNGM